MSAVMPVSAASTWAAAAVGGHPEHRTTLRLQIGDRRGQHGGLPRPGRSDDQLQPAIAGDSRCRLRLGRNGHLFEGLDQAAAERLDAAFARPLARSSLTLGASKTEPLPR